MEGTDTFSRLHFHCPFYEAERVRSWKTLLWLIVQQTSERAAPDNLTVLQLPLQAAWLVADKHAQSCHNSSRERLLLSTQVRQHESDAYNSCGSRGRSPRG